MNDVSKAIVDAVAKQAKTALSEYFPDDCESNGKLNCADATSLLAETLLQGLSGTTYKINVPSTKPGRKPGRKPKAAVDATSGKRSTKGWTPEARIAAAKRAQKYWRERRKVAKEKAAKRAAKKVASVATTSAA